MAFAKAIELAQEHIAYERKRLEILKNQLRKDLSDLPGIKFLGSPKTQLSSFLPLTLPGLDAERLIFALEDRGVYLSTGAACAASKGIKSPTLRAIGLSDEEIAGSLRITMGHLSDEDNIREAAQIIHEVVEAEFARINK